MEQYAEYLLKVSLGLAIEYLFYIVFLRKLTFYQWNRVFLTAYAMLAFVLPLVNPGSTLKPVKWSVESVTHKVYGFTDGSAARPDKVQERAVDTDHLVADSSPEIPPLRATLPWFYLAGVIVLMTRLSAGIVAVERLKRRSERITENGLLVYVSQAAVAPFALGKSVFLSATDFTSVHRDTILMHERIHVRQGHSWDTVFAELLVIFCWFNPFAWLLRRAIRQNLEFIVDQELLDQGVDRQGYQLLLLEVAGYGKYSFGNPFTFTALKDRVRMMNSFRSGKLHLAKFLFLVPVILVTLVMCRKGEIENERNTKGEKNTVVKTWGDLEVFAGIVIDAQTMKPVSNLRMKIMISDVAFDGLGTSAFTFNKKKIDSLYIETDADGFYYWKNTISSRGNGYWLGSDDPRYPDFAASAGSKVVAFVKPAGSVVYSREYFLTYPAGENIESQRQEKELLTSSLKECSDEFKLIADYKKVRTHSGKLITHFRNAYFNCDDQLIGYEGNLDFYLDGEKTTYNVINSTFEWRAPSIVTSSMEVPGPLNHQQREFNCYTAPLSRDKAPPKTLVTPSNFEWIQNLDLSRLNSEPYYLDGFRQIKGIGSNLKPEKGDIKRVALLKGALARYYNRSQDRVLWIETRPEEEIVGRPQF